MSPRQCFFKKSYTPSIRILYFIYIYCNNNKQQIKWVNWLNVRDVRTFGCGIDAAHSLRHTKHLFYEKINNKEIVDGWVVTRKANDNYTIQNTSQQLDNSFGTVDGIECNQKHTHTIHPSIYWKHWTFSIFSYGNCMRAVLIVSFNWIEMP